jgi:hypothetical protein
MSLPSLPVKESNNVGRLAPCHTRIVASNASKEATETVTHLFFSVRSAFRKNYSENTA